MAPHTFEPLDADFAAIVKPGDFVVAADSSGCGLCCGRAGGILTDNEVVVATNTAASWDAWEPPRFSSTWLPPRRLPGLP